MKRIFWALILLLWSPSVMAANMHYDAFARLPVQHEGRIKPLDTFARAMLENISGHQSLSGMDADAWLAETLFDPAQALHRPVFRIFRPEFLNLPARASKYYSYAELAPALHAKADIVDKLSRTEEKDWSEDQRELMRLSEASLLYTQLLRTFSFVLPLNIAIPAPLAKEWKISEERAFTLQDFRAYEDRLQKRLQAIIRKKGEDPVHYSDSERDIAQFAMDLQILERAGQDNILFRILPGEESEEWVSPWEFAQKADSKSAGYLQLWRDMATSYQQQDGDGWNKAARDAGAQSASFANTAKLRLEILYNEGHPTLLASIFYLCAFFGLVLYSLRGQETVRLFSLTTMLLGGLLHAATIAARIFILDRPPVGTLYESILFVSLICVVIAIVFEAIKKDGQGILIGSLAALILLFVAESFAEADTMKMLVAVLNTNFWLSTHVLCITMGYGWCLMTALLAHIWLVRTALGNNPGSITPIKILALVALLFTAVGTILGGIWADQSWGRFWGWDPKENGALLIVLWLIWALHGQIGGQLQRTAFIAMLAFLSVVVALAWFGVNLLSVGLHSYGFITGVAAGLGVFCTLELGFIGFLWLRIRRRRTGA